MNANASKPAGRGPNINTPPGDTTTRRPCRSPATTTASSTTTRTTGPGTRCANPDGSPLLCAAACLRGWLDTLRLIIDRTVGWIPPFLEQLDEWLAHQLGHGWWHQMPTVDVP
jgi:hypothetical protein